MEKICFDRELEEATKAAERILVRHMPKEKGRQKEVIQAMNYSLTAGGKRLRPVLMRETFRMCGGAGEEIIGCFMAAIEMIHTYSLVHDDLPAMDDDEYRRNRKTTHIVYGEDMGILAGDALLNFAFETACRRSGWKERMRHGSERRWGSWQGRPASTGWSEARWWTCSPQERRSRGRLWTLSTG